MKKIEVFIRHCYYSKLQEISDRIRPSWFNKIKVFENFKNTIDFSLANYTIIYDEFYGPIEKTFLAKEDNVQIINCGNESDSFLKTLEIVQSKNFSDDTIIYFLEDDYVHRHGWCEVLLEGFTLNSSYVTLYDFTYFIGKGYLSEIFMTKNSHWRAVPSTTNTFACKYKTLLEDLDLHKMYSTSKKVNGADGYNYTDDFSKFYKLMSKHKYIISPIPGWSTHCDNNYTSPFIDWENILNCNTGTEVSSKVKLNYQ